MSPNSGNFPIPVHRPLAHSSGLQAHSTSTLTYYTGSIAFLRHLHQLKEITPNSYTESSNHRAIIDFVAATRLHTKHRAVVMESVWLLQEQGNYDSKTPGSHVCSSLRPTLCESVYETITNHLSQIVLPAQAIPVENDSPVHTSEEFSSLVDFSRKYIPGCSIPHSTSKQGTDYRCFPVGLGCSPGK